jgi:uncharacterized protein (TIGR02266 family)
MEDLVNSTKVLADKRPDPRFFLRFAICLDGDNNFYLGLQSDIRASGGVFIATRTLLPIGTAVVLAFTFPGSQGEIRAGGRVQWTRGGGFGQDGVKAGMGIELTDLDAAAARRIHAFMWRRDADFFA